MYFGGHGKCSDYLFYWEDLGEIFLMWKLQTEEHKEKLEVRPISNLLGFGVGL